MNAAAPASLNRAVVDAEAVCGAEVVVVGYRAADAYVDVAWRNAAIGTLIALAAVLVVPFEVEHSWVLPIVAVVTVLTLLASLASPIVRLTSSKARRDHAVDIATKAAFVTRGVYRTRARIGMLVVWFERERAVRVVFDSGLEKAIPSDVRAVVSARLHAAMLDADSRAAAVTAIGAAFAPFLPREDDDENELDDAVEVVDATAIANRRVSA